MENISRLSIKYECKHTSCQVFCKKGVIELDKKSFDELSAECAEEGAFKSPSGSCRMGFMQPFQVVSITEINSEGEVKEEEVELHANDPIKILIDEHERVLELATLIEDQVRTRDLEGLWKSTRALENEIYIHSIKKEETGLFPLIQGKVPMGPGLVGIMNEDHLEFISLLHGFRCSLQEDDILDGVVGSCIANLRNHIRKENEEFFPLIMEHMTEEDKSELLELMAKIDKEHIPLTVGDRSKKELVPHSGDRDRLIQEIASVKIVSSIGGEEMCCGGH
ncbi:MAG: hemerythrin domain-containing protein [Deltaproteobacteria bacterium]|nr:hemerythrin domain-containing protein [Deltaproteobacteria bacterium]